MSYWIRETDAERYGRSRPYVHGLVTDKVRAFLKLAGRVPRALDVGCGTGQSTTALKAIAVQVVSLDVSRAMLRKADQCGVHIVQAAGEYLPFADERFDLATVALAFHWLRRERFLAEARRVLRPGGWLIVYNSFFLGQMRENPQFERWVAREYVRRYPTPQRKDQPLTDEEAEPHEFVFVHRETYGNEVAMSAAELSSYLMTQTNVLAAIQSKKEKPGDVQAWLAESLEPMFPVPTCNFRFGGYIWYLRRLASAIPA